MSAKITFYLNTPWQSTVYEALYIGIGADGAQICKLLQQHYQVDRLAYLHHSEDYNLHESIPYIPFPGEIAWRVGDITFPYNCDGMSPYLLQFKEDGALKYKLISANEAALEQLFTELDPTATLVGLWGDPLVNYLLAQPYTQDYKWVLRLPFRLEGYGSPNDTGMVQLAGNTNITLIDSQALFELLQSKALTLSQFVELLQQYICKRIIQSDTI